MSIPHRLTFFEPCEYRVVFDGTKKHRGKAVLECDVATTYPPGKSPYKYFRRAEA